MFTGIIETLGALRSIKSEGTNIHFTFSSSITPELKIDQSVAHNGVCLTVIDINEDQYVVTAIQETLNRTNFGALKVGDVVNLERCTQVGGRLDGHIVQGHVDQIATCTKVVENDGSWDFHFEYKPSDNITVEKGSITINGVSLTVVNSGLNTFSVSIIPYTYENTSFRQIEVGSIVNLEFDIVGKYVSKLMKIRG